MAAQALLTCWPMPPPVPRTERALLAWQHPGRAISHAKTQRRTKSGLFFFFFLWKERWFVKKQRPLNQHRQVQAQLQDYGTFTLTTSVAALPVVPQGLCSILPWLSRVPPLRMVWWVQRRWVSTEDSLLKHTLYSLKYNWKIGEPQGLYAQLQLCKLGMHVGPLFRYEQHFKYLTTWFIPSYGPTHRHSMPLSWLYSCFGSTGGCFHSHQMARTERQFIKTFIKDIGKFRTNTSGSLDGDRGTLTKWRVIPVQKWSFWIVMSESHKKHFRDGPCGNMPFWRDLLRLNFQGQHLCY